MLASLGDFSAAPPFSTRELPLFSCPVPADFPSSTDDSLNALFDLTRLRFRNPVSTFLARVSVGSMIGPASIPATLWPQTAPCTPAADQPRRQQLMTAQDALNMRCGRPLVQLVAAGVAKSVAGQPLVPVWAGRSAHRSPRYTTGWDELWMV